MIELLKKSAEIKVAIKDSVFFLAIFWHSKANVTLVEKNNPYHMHAHISPCLKHFPLLYALHKIRLQYLGVSLASYLTKLSKPENA